MHFSVSKRKMFLARKFSYKSWPTKGFDCTTLHYSLYDLQNLLHGLDVGQRPLKLFYFSCLLSAVNKTETKPTCKLAQLSSKYKHGGRAFSSLSLNSKIITAKHKKLVKEVDFVNKSGFVKKHMKFCSIIWTRQNKIESWGESLQYESSGSPWPAILKKKVSRKFLNYFLIISKGQKIRESVLTL